MLSPVFYSHCKGKSATGKLLPNFMNHDVFAVDVLVAAQLLISLVYSLQVAAAPTGKKQGKGYFDPERD